MRFSRTVAISMADLSHHAFRSFLTALGVVFGVGAVVAMMAISEGARQESLKQIEALGIDNVVVRSVKPTSGDSLNSGSEWSAMEYGITANDILHIGKVFENVKDLVPVRDMRINIFAQKALTNIHLFATTPDFLTLSRSRLLGSRSRFFSDLDGDKVNPVCVIGKDAAWQLFRYEDPIGKDIKIGEAVFRVVGVMENPYSVKMLGGYDLNNQMLIHIKTGNAVFGKTARKRTAGAMETVKVEADFLYVKVQNLDLIENTAERLKSYLDSTHKSGDFEIELPYDLLKQKEKQQWIYSIVLGSIAAISLLVGGIGIMNIMTANVYERTKEIGTRRALGAKKNDILLQFLVEAVLLTTIGGLIGVAIGYGLAEAVHQFAGMLTCVTLVSVMVSVGVSAAVGVAFGTYPAWKAANLDPITALRTE
ncbi:MAG: ABC transporter permease [Planctomycetes bacterium]|nr:ABC transporter permease [Planctomycetota bacterium]